MKIGDKIYLEEELDACREGTVVSNISSRFYFFKSSYGWRRSNDDFCFQSKALAGYTHTIEWMPPAKLKVGMILENLEDVGKLPSFAIVTRDNVDYVKIKNLFYDNTHDYFDMLGYFIGSTIKYLP